MPRPTREIDALIREALGPADAAVHDQFGGLSLFQLMFETFRGRHQPFVIGGFAAVLVLFVLGILSAIRFLHAPDLHQMILWGAATAFCIGIVTSIKIWFWLEMARHSIVREISRLQLQVVRLARKVSEDPGA